MLLDVFESTEEYGFGNIVKSCVFFIHVSSGEHISVLDGVLVAVKDEIDCMPYPTTGEFIARMFSVS